LCCGHAFPEAILDDEEARMDQQVELCHPVETTSIEYQATWDADKVTLFFECIEGASTFMVGIATFVSVAIASM
jgi:hypothetical protein